MGKTKGLGRGLDALFALETKASDLGTANELSVNVLVPGRYQPRSQMDQSSIKSLADSIHSQGIIQPILVRAIGNHKYEIIAGERRWRAAQEVGLETVPVVIREVEDEDAISMALIENIQREDLNPLEEASGIDRLITEFGLTHESAAKSLGKSRSAISNLLRLLSLDRNVQKLLMAGSIDMGHARALLSLEKQTQVEMANRIVTLGLSVRETERLVNSDVVSKQSKKTPRKSRDLQRLEDEISELLGLSSSIKHGKGGSGKLIINYGNLDQLDLVLTKLRK